MYRYNDMNYPTKSCTVPHSQHDEGAFKMIVRDLYHRKRLWLVWWTSNLSESEPAKHV